MIVCSKPHRCARRDSRRAADTGTDGEEANALVCKTSIRGFDPRSVLHKINGFKLDFRNALTPLNTTLTSLAK